MAVPPLIDRETLDAVQAKLKSRDPMVTPARVTSGPRSSPASASAQNAEAR